MTHRDRKDLPPATGTARTPAAESEHERAARKAHESHALDEALQETFPTSDPVSPFVPALRSSDEPAPDHAARCAHPACTCDVAPPDRWCSNACRDRRQGYAVAHETCGCGHASCRHANAAASAA
ncbi:hypothetical protein [Dokdonella sp.]|uniref:hypothetical protein n=1 Tax=Dokdonella sp. TaxID=2291710 RepID=UPI002F41F22C